MECVSRGDWWNWANALGDVWPVGKRLKVGEAGGAEYEYEDIAWIMMMMVWVVMLLMAVMQMRVCT